MIQSHCFEKRYEFLLSFYQMLILVQVPNAQQARVRILAYLLCFMVILRSSTRQKR